MIIYTLERDVNKHVCKQTLTKIRRIIGAMKAQMKYSLWESQHLHDLRYYVYRACNGKIVQITLSTLLYMWFVYSQCEGKK